MFKKPAILTHSKMPWEEMPDSLILNILTDIFQFLFSLSLLLSK